MASKIKFSKKRWMEIATIRAKILYIISCLFQVHIKVPDFEERAIRKKMGESKYWINIGQKMLEGFEKSLKGE